MFDYLISALIAQQTADKAGPAGVKFSRKATEFCRKLAPGYELFVSLTVVLRNSRRPFHTTVNNVQLRRVSVIADHLVGSSRTVVGARSAALLAIFGKWEGPCVTLQLLVWC